MAMYAGNPNDPNLNEDWMTAAMMNGTTKNAIEAGMATPTLTQRANDIARAEEAKFNTDLANKYAQAYMLAPVIQNMVPQTQPQPQQESPMLTTGLMPGLGQEETYQARPLYAQEQETPQELPQTLTQMARQKALDIINAKNLYAQGEALGGDKGAEIMQLAHTGAERARAELQQLGVDPAQYGLNGTYDEAVTGIGNNDIRAMQNILEGEMAESSDSYYNRVYRMLRDRGFASDIADVEANRRADEYSARRVQALNQAFNMYGRNGLVANDIGSQIISMMAEEDPNMANYYAGRYAGPLQEYAKQNARENAAIQHQYKSEDRAADQKNALERIGYQGQVTAQLKAVQAQLDRANKAQDFQYRVMLLDRQAQLQALNGGNGKGSSGNGANSAQIKVWQEEVKRADEWDEKHIGQEKDNPYRASANAYKAMIDRSQGLGQDSSSSWAEYGDVPNDFNAFGKWVDAMFEKNRQDGYPRTNEQIIAIAEGVNKQFADNYIDDSYRKPVESTATSTTVSNPPARSYPAVNVTIDNGDYGLESGQRGNLAKIFGNWNPTISRNTGDSELAKAIRASRGLS